MPQPVSVEPVKNTVFAIEYERPLRSNCDDQYFWMLFTSPTIRQSSRAFASVPVRHSPGGAAATVSLSRLPSGPEMPPPPASAFTRR